MDATGGLTEGEGAPARIGEYLVRRLIGEGGMGKVFEAQERLSKRRVALKVLRPELAASEQARSLFLNEMTILAHLDHPNIVRCLACTEVDGQLVMALEFLEGPTVRALLTARGRVPWMEAVSLVAGIAAGLVAAHTQSPAIVHRDLKPENVMVLPGGHVKVMDFGIAKVLQALKQATMASVGHSAGTLQYMSPEQIDAGEVDERSDLYCLGLILYELLGGRPPFESPSPRELLNLQCTATPPPLPDEVRASLPRGIEQILAQLLDKRPEARPRTAQDVLTALEPFAVAGGAVRPVEQAPARTGQTLSAAPRIDPGVSPPVVALSGPAPATAQRPQSSPILADTIGLLQQAQSPRTVSTRWAVAIVIGLSLLAAGLTYGVRLGLAHGAGLESVVAVEATP